MKRLFVVLCCLLIPIAAVAQQRTGNIYGTVVDAEGNPLPGVSVTLTGATIAPIPTQTSAEGKFRFLSLFPGNDYVIKAELQGFKTKTETGIIVNVGKNVRHHGRRWRRAPSKSRSRSSPRRPSSTPRRPRSRHTVNYEMLQACPRPATPGSSCSMTPAIQIDRENIGGVEVRPAVELLRPSGSTTQEWTVDGMQITDRNSGRLPRVLRLRLLRGNEHLHGDAGRRAPGPGHRRQHRHPPRRQQD